MIRSLILIFTLICSLAAAAQSVGYLSDTQVVSTGSQSQIEKKNFQVLISVEGQSGRVRIAQGQDVEEIPCDTAFVNPTTDGLRIFLISKQAIITAVTSSTPSSDGHFGNITVLKKSGDLTSYFIKKEM